MPDAPARSKPASEPELAPTSIARRVMLATVASTAVGGLLAALVAMVAVDRLIGAQADQRLRGALDTLADELDEEETERERRARLVGTLADENAEIATSGIRLSVLEGSVLLAGAPVQRVPDAGACLTSGPLGARRRACGGRYGPLLLVAGQRADTVGLLWWYLLAALAAVALGAGTGGLLGGVILRWAIGPLHDLTARLRTVDPDRPGDVDLGSASACAEVRAVQEAVGELAVRVQTLLGQARSFAANAAHELRTPLTALRTELELLAEDVGDPASTAALERACARAAHVTDLVERLLVLALPAEKLLAGFEAVSLSELAQDVADDLPAGARGRAQLIFDDDGVVRGDAALLRALIKNGVDNALKFSREAIQVHVGAPVPGRVCVRVRDRGPGIAAPDRERAFEAFFRAPTAQAPGHGLGLALIAHVARVHNGTAELVSDPTGTTLEVRLPAWTGTPPGPHDAPGVEA